MGAKSSSGPKLCIGTLLLLACASCGSPSGSARTVSYFQAHPKEREALFKRCADDPGDLGKTPECVNVIQAEAIEGMGSFKDLPRVRFPRVPGTTVKKPAPVSGSNSAP